MKHLLAVTALAVLCALALPAQSLVSRPARVDRTLDTGLFVVANTLQTIDTETNWVQQITLTNSSASSVTVSICDRQGTPVCISNTLTTLTSGAHMVLPYAAGLKFTNGITIVASAAAAVQASIVTKKQ